MKTAIVFLTFIILGIGIQGQVLGNNWVTSFRVTYSLDGITWIPYTRKDFPQEKVSNEG